MAKRAGRTNNTSKVAASEPIPTIVKMLDIAPVVIEPKYSVTKIKIKPEVKKVGAERFNVSLIA